MLVTDAEPLLHKNYNEAILLYGMQTINHICLLFLHSKFFILIAERILAYKKREVYENIRNNYVAMIFGVTFVISVGELLGKLYVFMVLEGEDSIDLRVSKALTISDSPVYFLIAFFVCYNCCFIGYLLPYSPIFTLQSRL
uniref:7TM_GPCR_Srx domain-containing protein n=1 Tax=Bursaphelenchus xylophilus TaxID=6326 RepID=A0A1I7SEY7_BURXY